MSGAGPIAALRAQCWQRGYRPMAVYSWDFVEPPPPPGKKPTPPRAGKGPYGNQWQLGARQDPPEIIDLGTVVAWAQNTGILCDGLRAIDIDVDDPQKAGAIGALASIILGATIVRTRENSPRRLLVYRAAEGEPAKLTLTGAAHSKDNACKIEVLGKGQQFVAYGRHPSGADLQWLDGGPAETDLGSVQRITEDLLHKFLNACVPVIGAEPIEQAKPKPRSNGHDADGPPTAAVQDITAALTLIPNSGAPDWESWNNVGLAIYAATEGSAAGERLWLDWSAKNPADDEDTTQARWDHYGKSPPDRTGAGKLFAMAAAASPGWRQPSKLGARHTNGEAREPVETREAPPAEVPPSLPPPPPDDPGGEVEDEEPPDDGPPEVPPAGDPAGPGQDPPLPVISCRAGELPRMVREAEEALLKAGAPIYQRSVLVRPAEQEYPAADGSTTHSAALVAITSAAMLGLLSRVAIWQKWDGRVRGGGGWVTCDPPLKVVEILLANRGEWTFPVVRGILTSPTLRPDGSLLTAPGYDPQSRYYLMFPTGLVLPDIPEAPSIADAAEAFDRLDRLLDSYDFVEDGGVSRSVALALLMTQVLRCGMAVSPLLAVSATAPGSGKSHLVDLASTIAIGRPCPIMGAGKNDEETEKGINTKLLSSVAGFSIDNVHRMVDLAVLNIATERPMISIRLFGLLESIEVENSATIYMTGNNLPVIDEQVRRTVLCSLDAGVERPEQREFDVDPIATVLADRGRYIADILIIARAYLKHGSKPAGMKPFGSYPGWSRLVREPLIWLGQPDPVQSQDASRASDPEVGRLRSVMDAWLEAFGLDTPTTLADAVRFAFEPQSVFHGDPYDEVRNAALMVEHVAAWATHTRLKDILVEAWGKGKDVDTGRFGNWLKRYAGRVVGGMMFLKGDTSHSAVQWRLAKRGGRGG